jgi:hypothetical protein
VENDIKSNILKNQVYHSIRSIEIDTTFLKNFKEKKLSELENEIMHNYQTCLKNFEDPPTEIPEKIKSLEDIKEEVLIPKTYNTQPYRSMQDFDIGKYNNQNQSFESETSISKLKNSVHNVFGNIYQDSDSDEKSSENIENYEEIHSVEHYERMTTQGESIYGESELKRRLDQYDKITILKDDFMENHFVDSSKKDFENVDVNNNKGFVILKNNNIKFEKYFKSPTNSDIYENYENKIGETENQQINYSIMPQNDTKNISERTTDNKVLWDKTEELMLETIQGFRISDLQKMYDLPQSEHELAYSHTNSIQKNVKMFYPESIKKNKKKYMHKKQNSTECFQNIEEQMQDAIQALGGTMEIEEVSEELSSELEEVSIDLDSGNKITLNKLALPLSSQQTNLLNFSSTLRVDSGDIKNDSIFQGDMNVEEKNELLSTLKDLSEDIKNNSAESTPIRKNTIDVLLRKNRNNLKSIMNQIESKRDSFGEDDD